MTTATRVVLDLRILERVEKPAGPSRDAPPVFGVGFAHTETRFIEDDAS